MTQENNLRTELPDGLDVLLNALSVADIMKLIEKTARWVSSDTFKIMPVWYPEYSRRTYFYKKNWSEPQENKNRNTGNSVHKQEGNTRANEALTRALGLTKKERPNWSCCHIWGSDDLSYQTHNAIVQDPKFYSCLANMVLLPSPLKAFTDALIEVKTMLRVCAKYMYSWECDHESLEVARQQVLEFSDWEIYPKSWPTPERKITPIGTIPLNTQISKNIIRRKSQLKNDIKNAGEFYPRDSVISTLKYWKIQLEDTAQ